jgi:hypothetical protein
MVENGEADHVYNQETLASNSGCVGSLAGMYSHHPFARPRAHCHASAAHLYSTAHTASANRHPVPHGRTCL